MQLGLVQTHQASKPRPSLSTGDGASAGPHTEPWPHSWPSQLPWSPAPKTSREGHAHGAWLAPSQRAVVSSPSRHVRHATNLALPPLPHAHDRYTASPPLVLPPALHPPAVSAPAHLDRSRPHPPNRRRLFFYPARSTQAAVSWSAGSGSGSGRATFFPMVLESSWAPSWRARVGSPEQADRGT